MHRKFLKVPPTCARDVLHDQCKWRMVSESGKDLERRAPEGIGKGFAVLFRFAMPTGGS